MSIKKLLAFLGAITMLAACGGGTASGSGLVEEPAVILVEESSDYEEDEEELVVKEPEKYGKINDISRMFVSAASADKGVSEFVVSGYSINEAFYQLYPYATGASEKALSKLTADLPVTDPQFKRANLFVIDDELELNTEETDGFVRRDLQDVSIVGYINKFASDNTNNLINQMINTPFKGGTRAVILNAVYFKGTWEEQFNKERTEKDIFHAKTGDVKKDFMMKQADYLYNGSDMIELRYKDSSFVMDVIKDVDDIDTRFKQYLDEIETTKFKSTDIILKLPKFEVASDIDVKSVFLGSDYSDIFTGSYDRLADDITVDDAIQKAKIIVDEQGTEAAAVTMMTMKLTSAMPVEPPIEFTVDSQFLYIIRDTKTNAIIFAGFVR